MEKKRKKRIGFKEGLLLALVIIVLFAQIVFANAIVSNEDFSIESNPIEEGYVVDPELFNDIEATKGQS